MKKIYSYILITMLIFAVFAYSTNAAAKEKVSVTINGNTFYIDNLLLTDGTTYVPLEPFRKALGDDFSKNVIAYENYISCEGRFIHYQKPGFYIGKIFFVPVRAAAMLYGAEVTWIEAERTVYVSCHEPKILTSDEVYDPDELYWLSRIISAESEGESLAGKLAVGSVILNRCESDDFPDTVYGVIFDREYAVQFTPTSNGRIYREPTAESVMAAKMCLEGYRTSNDILYFLHENISTNLWTAFNREYALTVGQHDFYS